ncbi:MAG TPA: alpha/beta hydrolase, partial [Candidatus Paceibacterota bacterium]|nr:alpha/beta hydrolase [Candidatus Paceibacterota bacterium]
RRSGFRGELPMKIRKKIVVGLAVVAVLIATAMTFYARSQAHRLITNPVVMRKLPKKTPADYRLPFWEVTLTNQSRQRLVAWYVPSSNHVVILAQHGYKSCRDEMLPAAAALHRHGYGVLLSSVRAHDRCDGEQISFGVREVEDMELWLQYLMNQPDVDTHRIGALGNSMGGSLVIQLAAQDPRVKAVVADSAFSSLEDTVATSVRHYTGLPAFPFAPLIRFWANVESGCDLSRINAKVWIQELGSRPVFLMQGGADTTVSRQSGELLYAAAQGPKELWFDPAAGHAKFSTNMPAYELRVTAFFDRALHLKP